MKNESPYNKMLKTRIRFSRPFGVVKTVPTRKERKARADRLLNNISKLKRNSV